MNEYLELFNKVLDGTACCSLEASEGIGCFNCPYRPYKFFKGYERYCQGSLEEDTAALRKALERL